MSQILGLDQWAFMGLCLRILQKVKLLEVGPFVARPAYRWPRKAGFSLPPGLRTPSPHRPTLTAVHSDGSKLDFTLRSPSSPSAAAQNLLPD